MSCNLFRCVCIIMISKGLMGCGVFPKTTALSTLHDTYRREFIQAELPEAKSVSLEAKEPQGLQAGSFQETLAAIADYRRKYPDATKELSHLTVLEGMIYLQSRQFGLARLAAKDVEAAGKNLSASESAPRDSLFAAVFASLVDGWEVIARHETGTPNINDKPKEYGEILAQAADRMQQKLCEVKNAGRLRVVEGDQGASYIATTAAIFYFWVDHTAAFRCEVHKEEAVCTGLYKPAVYLDRGRDLLWTFLPTPVQIALQEDTVARKNAKIEGVVRFGEHHRALKQGIEKRSETFPAFPASLYQDPCNLQR
jgi:hypothetical protein